MNNFLRALCFSISLVFLNSGAIAGGGDEEKPLMINFTDYSLNADGSMSWKLAHGSGIGMFHVEYSVDGERFSVIKSFEEEREVTKYDVPGFVLHVQSGYYRIHYFNGAYHHAISPTRKFGNPQMVVQE